MATTGDGEGSKDNTPREVELVVTAGHTSGAARDEDDASVVVGGLDGSPLRRRDSFLEFITSHNLDRVPHHTDERRVDEIVKNLSHKWVQSAVRSRKARRAACHSLTRCVPSTTPSNRQTAGAAVSPSRESPPVPEIPRSEPHPPPSPPPPGTHTAAGEAKPSSPPKSVDGGGGGGGGGGGKAGSSDPDSDTTSTLAGYVSHAFVAVVLLLCFLVPVLTYQSLDVDPDTGLHALPVRKTRVALAAIPIVLVFTLILGMSFPSRVAAPIALVVTIVFGTVFFQSHPSGFFQDSDGNLPGPKDIYPWGVGRALLVVLDRLAWTAFDYVFNVWSAFFLVRVFELWGIAASMAEDANSVAATSARRILLIGFGFGILLAVVAPGGSSLIVAGSMLLRLTMKSLHPAPPETMRYAAYRIALVLLFGNALISAFNLLGICVTTTVEDVRPLDTRIDRPTVFGAEREVSQMFSMAFLPFGVAAPAICAVLGASTRGLWPSIRSISGLDWVILIASGVVYSAVQLLVSWGLGPELPCVLATGSSMLVAIGILKFKGLIPPSQRGWKDYAHYLPLAVLLAVLVVLRVIPGAEDALTDDAALNPTVWKVDNGQDHLDRQFPWLWHSGVVVLLVGIATPFMVPFRDIADSQSVSGVKMAPDTPFPASSFSTRRQFRDRMAAVRVRMLALNTFLSTGKQTVPEFWHRARALGAALSDATADVAPIVVSITAYASVAKLESAFGMTDDIAAWLSDEVSAGVFALVIPVLGTIGSALTGSTTTAGFLFARLQIRTSQALGIITPTANSPYELAALNMFAATTGEQISPMNAVVLTVLAGLKHTTEAQLIKGILPLAFCWFLATVGVTYLFLIPGDGGFDWRN